VQIAMPSTRYENLDGSQNGTTDSELSETWHGHVPTVALPKRSPGSLQVLCFTWVVEFCDSPNLSHLPRLAARGCPWITGSPDFPSVFRSESAPGLLASIRLFSGLLWLTGKKLNLDND